ENRIARLLQGYGYWQAQVGAKLERHEETQQVDVQFQLMLGIPARVGKLTVTGDPGLSSSAAMALCKLQPGARVRRDEAQRAMARLRKLYVQQHRLAAQLTPGAPVFHTES